MANTVIDKKDIDLDKAIRDIEHNMVRSANLSTFLVSAFVLGLASYIKVVEDRKKGIK